MSKGSEVPERIKQDVIDALADGQLTIVKISEVTGVPERTIYTWRQDAQFIQKVLDRANELLRESLPKIYKALLKKAESGSFNHIKLIIEHLDKLEELKASGTGQSITFSWNVKNEENEDDRPREDG